MEIIGQTMIGSHIWNMNHAESDKDYFTIYTEEIYNILKHTAKYKSVFKPMPELNQDIHFHEVSHVIEQLIKGNVNFLIGVLSPIVKDKSPAFMELRKMVRRNLSKNCYHSINGMSEGNYIKYVMKEKDVSEHKCNQILRAIQFGITLLQRGKVDFREYTGGTPDEILEMLSILKYSYEVSPLPELPSVMEYRFWLKDFRIEQIKYGFKEGIL